MAGIFKSIGDFFVGIWSSFLNLFDPAWHNFISVMVAVVVLFLIFNFIRRSGK